MMTLAAERLARGLCPRCGKEAAPYRLCHDHRMIEMIGRMMSAGVKTGAVAAVRGAGRGRPIEYSLADACAPWSFQAAFEGSKGFADRRYRPRLGKVPVDVGRELAGIILATFGRPASLDEIVAAWGKLREARAKRISSLAGDMTALILAQRRREARNKKRLETR